MITTLPSMIVKCGVLSIVLYVWNQVQPSWAVTITGILGIFWILRDLEIEYKLVKLKKEQEVGK